MHYAARAHAATLWTIDRRSATVTGSKIHRDVVRSMQHERSRLFSFDMHAGREQRAPGCMAGRHSGGQTG
jgi:hypothetical protein